MFHPRRLQKNSHSVVRITKSQRLLLITAVAVLALVGVGISHSAALKKGTLSQPAANAGAEGVQPLAQTKPNSDFRKLAELTGPRAKPASRFTGPLGFLNPTAAIITASKTDALLVDNDSDTEADPGDTLRYTVTIGVSGMDATGVMFTDTVDPNTAIVPGSLRTTPLARPDSYTATGNVRITKNAAAGVLINDQDFDGVGPAVSVTAGTFLSTNSGNVTISADGSFTYNPPPGFEGNDTFTYTLNDNDTPNQTDTGTVTIAVSGMFWFVNSGASCPCDGRLTNPFNLLTGAGSFNAVAADDPGDNIFLYTGSYTGGLTLLDNQRLIGQGAGASLQSITGITPPPGSDALPTTGGTRPTVANAAGSVILLGAGNYLRGFDIGNSAAGGSGISGTNIGTLTVTELLINGTGRAMNLDSGTLGATFDSITSTNSTTNGIRLNNVGGLLTISGTTTVTNATQVGITISNVSNIGPPSFQFGTVNINNRNTTGILLDEVDNSGGTMSFGVTTIPNPNNAGGYGIRVEDSAANVTVASATISNANLITAQSDGGNDGTPDTDGDGDAIFLTNNTGSFTLNGGTLSNCGNDCIDLRNSTGLVLSAVNITSPGLDVTAATGAGFGGHGISAFNLRGTASVSGGAISSFNTGNRDGFYLLNNTSTALTLTVQGTTFQNSVGNRGFGIRGDAAANMTITVGGATNNVATNCTFSNISAVALQSIAGGTAGSTATVNLTVQNSTFQNSPLNGKTNLIAGVGEAGKSTLVIQDNTFSNVFNTASTGEALININNDGLLAGNQLGLTLQRNNINNVGTALSNCGGGATPCLGPVQAILIFIDDAANVPSTLIVDNNTITNVQQGAILLDMANTGAPSSAVSAKIINNCIGRLRVAGACTGADARVGVNPGLANGRGIAVERRRNNSLSGNVLISGNNVRNGNGQNEGALLTAPIFARTKANSTMSVTVTNNNVDSTFISAPEMRFDTNANDVGDIVSPTQCVDVTGNTVAAGAGLIQFGEINGTLNIEQASLAAVAAANGLPAGNVTVSSGAPSFGIVCAVPPAAPDPADTIADTLPPTTEQTAAPVNAEQAAAPQVVVPSDSITNRPFVSSPRVETTKDVTGRKDLIVTSGVTGVTADIGNVKPRTKPTTPVLINPTPPVIVGNNINWNIGTLPAGQSVTITFQVQVENPYIGPAQVSNQGTVTADGGISVLTDDPSVGGGTDPTVTPIDAPPDINIKDAEVAEPASGTTSMLFVVALSAPATGPVSVNFATANGGATPATGGTCVGGADYETTNGTVNFIAGQQLQTIAIPVCSDATAEGDETFLVNLSTPTNGIIVDGQATGTITPNTPGVTLISELRTSGPGGTNDDFVEIYNNTNSPLIVAASDASAGYGLFKMGAACGDTPVLLGTIPNGTNIPARGHYLLVGSAYSLANYGGAGAAAGNLTMTSDIENDRNVALFDTSNILNISSATKLDAVGFGANTGNNCDLLREGTNLGAASGSTSEYSFVRKLATGTPQDTNDNAADFSVVSTTPLVGVGTNATPILGGAGPENLANALQRNATIKASLVDPGVASTVSPNRVRDLTPDIPNNSTFGTLDIRRKFTNNTGGAITRLRFRIVDVTTTPQPVGTADLRARSSGNVVVTITGGSMPTVIGTTLETPPAQPNGGGLNSTMSAGTITLGTPLANGASINVRFLLGVQQNGGFRFFINVEALP